MKIASLVNRTLLVVGTVGLVALAMPAFAQNAKKVQVLQRVIEAQQRQLEAQQQQLDTQRQLLDQLQAQIQGLARGAATGDTAAVAGGTGGVAVPGAATGAAVAEDVTVAARTSPAEPKVGLAKTARQRTDGLSDKDMHDLVSPTGSNYSYSKSAITLTVPKTKTEIGLHGFAQFQTIYDSDGLNSNEFDTFLIPVDGAPSQTKFSINPSRFGLTSATRLGFGRINTLISMDFNAKLDAPEPRLREAYGEFIHDDLDFAFLGGQTFGTMLDLKSMPETVDFAGPTGAFARRQPLLRFSKLFNHKVRLDIAAETPENVVYLDADARTRAPDFIVAGAWDVRGKYVDHVRLAALFRDLNADDMSGNSDSVFGWAIAGSGKVKLPLLGERDNFKFGIQYGEGYGGQLKSGPADAAFNPVTGDMETIGVFSTYGGIQHWWSDRFRSNLVYGYVDADNPGFIDDDKLENTTYIAVDLIWKPFKSVTLGAEYLWGRRENKSGASGIANRVLFSSKVDF